MNSNVKFTTLTKPLLKAHYLLTPDSELQTVGSETKIPYKADYDFYLQCLLKHSNWAIKTINFFNTGIFGSKKVDTISNELTVPSTPSHSWEDDFLDDLDNAKPAVQMLASNASISSAQLIPNILAHEHPWTSLSSDYCSPTCSQHLPISSPSSPLSPIGPSPPPSSVLVTSVVSISNHLSAATTMSSVLKFQVDVGHMSITGTMGVAAEATDIKAALGHQAPSAHHVIMPVPIQLPDILVPASFKPLVQKCATHNCPKIKK